MIFSSLGFSDRVEYIYVEYGYPLLVANVHYRSITGFIPVEGIKVFLANGTNVFWKETDPNGDAVFDGQKMNISAGKYAVEIRKVPDMFLLPERQEATLYEKNATGIIFELKLKEIPPLIPPNLIAIIQENVLILYLSITFITSIPIAYKVVKTEGKRKFMRRVEGRVGG